MSVALIRKCTVSDKQKICLLSEQINQNHYDNMPHDFRMPDGTGDWEHWAAFLSDERGVFLVAELDGEVVGFIACRVIDSGKLSFLVRKTKLHISTIVVIEAAKRKGIGRKLVVGALQAGSHLGATEAFLEVMSYNKSAHAFYESLGFGNFSEKMSLSLTKSGI